MTTRITVPWSNPGKRNSTRHLQLTQVVACDQLYKRDVFRFPDPFVILTVDSAQSIPPLTKRNQLLL
jgi:hypothetical protein